MGENRAHLTRYSVNFGAVIIVVFVALLFLWASHSSSYYRMTVVIETPEGVKTGSVVRKVTVDRNFTHMSSVHVRGEALVVDLGKRGMVFALMNGDLGGPNYAELGVLGLQGTAIKTKLSPGQYPMFVRFRDLNDPKTVEKVIETRRIGTQYPLQFGIKSDHFEEMFGAGVKLREVFIEPSDDDITTGIVQVLPWLLKLHGYISGEFSSGSQLYQQLDVGDFRRG